MLFVDSEVYTTTKQQSITTETAVCSELDTSIPQFDIFGILATLADFLTDPHDGGVGDADKETAPDDARARNHRQILLGTWLLASKDEYPSIARLIEEELEGFLAESPVRVSPAIFQALLN
ncbi:MAG: hypothetical protein OXE94_03295 [Aestuariivita sp.]|nr:hypothetical protein [Aestuariivita sp.]MCY4201921.1 hypothetical protein [Aestuariivita sp.]